MADIIDLVRPPRRTRYRARRRPVNLAELRLVLLSGVLLGLAYGQFSDRAEVGPATAVGQTSFGLCDVRWSRNCVVDGDTFWQDGEKVRVADIDTPETHPSRCPYEAELGDKATQRLRALLNQGAFELRSVDRDRDRYGRKLRTVVRDGRSLGGILVSEGLAREWTGRRRPWCA